MLLLSSLLLLIASGTKSSSSICPKKYELAYAGQCHRQYDAAVEVDAANAPSTAKYDCSKDGALPVIIRNQEDHDYWWSVAQRDKKKGTLLLGITCPDAKRPYVWADGSEITFRPEIYDKDLDEPCHDNGYHFCMFRIDAKSGAWKADCNVDVTVDIYCVLIPSQPTLPKDPDCVDFSHDDVDDVCYQVSSSSSNISEASVWCKGFGANVASVHTQQENSFIRRLATSRGLVDGLLLGGKLTGKDSQWTDGSTFDYSNFAPGFPIDGLGECLAMETNNVNGQWLNVDCSTQLPFACVRKPSDPEPSCDGNLRAEGDIIVSPGFPFNSSQPCDFMLKVDAGMLVEVEIILLEANSCCDHLILTEGPLGGTSIANLTGDKNNGKTFRTSSQNVMRASWQPNGAVNVRGMMIIFRGVKKE